MRRVIVIGLLLLLAMTACQGPQREARQMVRRAERLFGTDPDSTVRLIDSVLRIPAYFEEGKRMDIAMLQAEALFGDRDDREISPLMDDEFFDDKPFLTTSPELERAADYYARKKKFDKAAHAALYSGFVQQHYGEKTHAMQSLKDAERYGGMVKDSLTVARAEYKMGKMLLDDGMGQEALSVLRNAELGFGNRFAEKTMTLNAMGVCNMLQGDFSKAEICLKQCLQYLSQDGHSNYSKLERKVLNNYAVLYRIQRNYVQAIGCLRQFENNHDLDEKELLLLNLNLGNVFFEEGIMDSADCHYKFVKDILPVSKAKPETQLAAYDALYNYSLSRNEDSLALLYRERHESVLFAIMQQRQEQSVYRIQRQYDYENLQNTLNRKIITRHRIILIISILLLFTAVIILMLQFRHKQMRKAETEMKRQIDALKKDLRESAKSSYLEQELSSRLRLIVLAWRTQKKANDPQKKWNPIVIKLMNGKESVFEAVVEEMEKVYPDLYAVIRQKHPVLNETEAKVCLLSCSDLSNTEMAEILEVSKHTVDKNRSKLRDKLNLKPESMKEQLRKILFD